MTTNLLERAFVEQKRRTKIIPRFFDKKSCLKLVYASTVRASQKWRRVKMNEYDLVLLRNTRKLDHWEESDDGVHILEICDMTIFTFTGNLLLDPIFDSLRLSVYLKYVLPLHGTGDQTGNEISLEYQINDCYRNGRNEDSGSH
jgi:hypothetical protein